jgi:hypothetical protein
MCSKYIVVAFSGFYSLFVRIMCFIKHKSLCTCFGTILFSKVLSISWKSILLNVNPNKPTIAIAKVQPATLQWGCLLDFLKLSFLKGYKGLPLIRF